MADLDRGTGCRADRCLISKGRSRRPWAATYAAASLERTGRRPVTSISAAGKMGCLYAYDPYAYLKDVPKRLPSLHHSAKPWVACPSSSAELRDIGACCFSCTWAWRVSRQERRQTRAPGRIDGPRAGATVLTFCALRDVQPLPGHPNHGLADRRVVARWAHPLR